MASAKLWLGGEMEKSVEEKEIGDIGSKSRNMYFRKRSNIIKSTPLSLHGVDSHFPDVFCQVFHKVQGVTWTWLLPRVVLQQQG